MFLNIELKLKTGIAYLPTYNIMHPTTKYFKFLADALEMVTLHSDFWVF